MRIRVGRPQLRGRAGVREAACLLLELSREFESYSDWQLDRDACARIAEDPGTQVLVHDHGFNFRYGGVYLSASKTTAARYARLYDCGSETHAYTLRLYERIGVNQPGLASRKEFSALCAFARRSKKPLLVEARDVELASLRAEQGGGHSNLLAHIERSLEDDPELYDLMVQQTNFELVRPVPTAQLLFYEVKKVEEASGELEFLPFGKV
jgi:hypothetical protein